MATDQVSNELALPSTGSGGRGHGLASSGGGGTVADGGAKLLQAVMVKTLTLVLSAARNRASARCDGLVSLFGIVILLQVGARGAVSVLDLAHQVSAGALDALGLFVAMSPCLHFPGAGCTYGGTNEQRAHQAREIAACEEGNGPLDHVALHTVGARLSAIAAATRCLRSRYLSSSLRLLRKKVSTTRPPARTKPRRPRAVAL